MLPFLRTSGRSAVRAARLTRPARMFHGNDSGNDNGNGNGNGPKPTPKSPITAEETDKPVDSSDLFRNSAGPAIPEAAEDVDFGLPKMEETLRGVQKDGTVDFGFPNATDFYKSDSQLGDFHSHGKTSGFADIFSDIKDTSATATDFSDIFSDIKHNTHTNSSPGFPDMDGRPSGTSADPSASASSASAMDPLDLNFLFGNSDTRAADPADPADPVGSSEDPFAFDPSTSLSDPYALFDSPRKNHRKNNGYRPPSEAEELNFRQTLADVLRQSIGSGTTEADKAADQSLSRQVNETKRGVFTNTTISRPSRFGNPRTEKFAAPSVLSFDTLGGIAPRYGSRKPQAKSEERRRREYAARRVAAREVRAALQPTFAVLQGFEYDTELLTYIQKVLLPGVQRFDAEVARLAAQSGRSPPAEPQGVSGPEAYAALEARQVIPASVSENEGGNESKSFISYTAFAQLLPECIRLLADCFELPVEALTLFEVAKRQSVQIFASTCTVDVYNQVLKTRWEYYQDLYAVEELVREMQVNGIEGDHKTYELTQRILRDYRAHVSGQNIRLGAGGDPVWNRDEAAHFRNVNVYSMKLGDSLLVAEGDSGLDSFLGL